MEKFNSDSYIGVLKENLCEPIYAYLGYLVVYCEKDCFDKIFSILNKYKNMDDYTIDYFINLILFYIKRRIYISPEDTVVKQIENVIKHYSHFASCVNSELDDAFQLVGLLSKDDADFDERLKEVLLKFCKHFGCSLNDDIGYKKIYDEINIDGVPSTASISEENGLFGEDKIYIFDNQFLVDIDIFLDENSSNPYEQLKNDIIKNILMHIGYLYLNPDKMVRGERNVYLELGELLENIDDLVEMFLIKIINLYIAFKVTNRGYDSSSCKNGIEFIEKKLQLYGFDVGQITDDVNKVCKEFISQGNFRMLDIYCERILHKFFSYFGLEKHLPKISEIASLYSVLGFPFNGITDLYNSVEVYNVDMENKIPFIDPEKYDDPYNYKYVPSFFGQRCTYVELAKKNGLTDSQISDICLELSNMLRYYDVGINSVYGNMFLGIWNSGHGIYSTKHGFSVYDFLSNEIFEFFGRKNNPEKYKQRSRIQSGT